MNVWMFVIEAIILVVIFSCMILIPLMKNPIWWIHDYPEDIQEEYFKTHERIPVSIMDKSVFVKKSVALVLAFLFLLGISCLAGAKDFVSGLLISYAFWSIINWYDCFILDWIFFANIKRIRLPGTEHMDKAYHQKWYHFKRALYGSALGLLPSFFVGMMLAVI